MKAMKFGIENGKLTGGKKRETNFLYDVWSN